MDRIASRFIHEPTLTVPVLTAVEDIHCELERTKNRDLENGIPQEVEYGLNLHSAVS
jgi:hypothetical protein